MLTFLNALHTYHNNIENHLTRTREMTVIETQDEKAFILSLNYCHFPLPVKMLNFCTIHTLILKFESL